MSSMRARPDTAFPATAPIVPPASDDRAEAMQGPDGLAPWQRGLRVHAAGHRLEDRIMLDAAGAAAADVATDVDPLVAVASTDALRDDVAGADAEPATATDVADDAPARREVVIVDTSVDGHRALLEGIDGADDPASWRTDPATGTERLDIERDGGSVTVYRIDGAADGIDGVTAVLARESGVDALHVLSHGSEASIIIGDERLDAGSLDAHRDALGIWGAALTDDGDILLYGCDTAGSDAGLAFIAAFADATRADIAASNDPTGHAALGGDWDLEVHEGSIETDIVVDDDGQAAFEALLAPTPSAALSIPVESFLNESFSFTVTLDNTGDEPGYEPYVDLFAEPGATLDGASFLGADVPLGDALTWSAGTGAWTDAGGAPVTEHPLNAEIALPAAPGIDGMSWYTVELPFGSFVPDQPAAALEVAGTLAKPDGAAAGTPLAIHAQAGFELGRTALDDPATDPPLVGTLQVGSITPTLLEIDKEAASGGPNAVGDEDEHATGPNNPITWTVTVDIADGETIDAVAIEDVLGGDIHYLGNLQVTGAGTLVGQGVTDATVGVTAGNALQVSFASVTGTASDADIVLTYEGYIPDIDAAGATVLNPATAAADSTVPNTVTIDADHEGAALPQDGDVHEIRPLSLATQKSVSILDGAGAPAGRDTIIPGDILEWRLEVQVSDYFSLKGFELTDTFGDGHLYIDGSETLQVYANGTGHAPVTIGAGNVALGTIDPATGDTTVVYDVAAELVARGASTGADPDGRLDGDLVDGTREGRTTFVVTFRTQVQEDFQFPAVYGGDASVDVGDRLGNREVVDAVIVASGNAVSDTSAASVVVTTPESTKTIYAIDGDTDGFDTGDAELAPGQTVTYRITIDLPTTDVESLVVTDYLPLPVFAVPTDYTYAGQFTGTDNVPAAGQWGIGPATNAADFPAGFLDTGPDGELQVVDPDTDAAANSVTWAFDSFDRDGSTGGTLDILFTTVTQDVPFADGLNLTNQASIGYDNTNNPQALQTEIVQIETLAPELAISKGVVGLDAASAGTLGAAAGPVAFDAPGSATPFSGSFDSAALAATPIDADATGLDGGDVVRFAIVVENAGGFQATDIVLADSFPAGFEIPGSGANLRAALADGTPVAVTGALFDATGAPDAAGARLELGGGELALARGHEDDVAATDGANIVVVTYDLVVADAANAADTLVNTAELLSFSAIDGGTDYTQAGSSAGWLDTASVTLETVGIDKTLVGTSIVTTGNANAEAVAGEYVDYRLVLIVPEGSLDDAYVLDRLDPGLAFDSLVSVVPDAGGDIATNLGGGPAGSANFGNAVATTSIDGGGAERIRIELGDIVNADGSGPETVTITYRAYVLASAAAGANLNNRADIRWARPFDGAAQERNFAGTVAVIAPDLDIDKSIEGAPPIDVGDTVTYRIVVDHASGSTATAFEASLTDALPTQITGASLVSVTDAGGSDVTAGAGFALAGDDASGYTLANPDFDLAEGESFTILVTGTVGSATTGAPIDNVANLAWSTLDDDIAADGRDADEGTFTANDSASFTIAPPEIVKTVTNTGIGAADGIVVQGEYVDYRVVITVPEGETPDAVLIDTLPAGLRHVAGSTVVEAVATSGGTTSPTVAVTYTGPGVTEPAGPGGELRLDFGTIANTDRDNASVEQIVVSYRAYATGTGASDGSAIGNAVALRWDLNGDGDATDAGDGLIAATSTVTFREAVLDIANTLVVTPVDAGDAVEYEIVVSHAAGSSVEAYDITLSDLLPAGLENVVLASATHSANGDDSARFDVTGNALTSVSTFDLAPGETMILRVQATVATDAGASTRIDNVAEVSWESLGDDLQGDQSAQSSATDTAADDFAMASPTFDRATSSTGITTSANDDGELVAGEYALHTLTVTVPEGTTLDALVTDVLEPGLTFDTGFQPTVAFSADTGAPGLSAGPIVPTVGTDGAGNTTVAFDLGDVRNAAPNDGDAETVTITYRTYTEHAAGSPAQAAPGDVLDATATLAWDGNADGDNTDAATESLQDADALDVVHPVLALSNAIQGIVPSDAGDQVTYRYEVSHAGGSTADAFDAAFATTLPGSISGASITSVTGADAADFTFVIDPVTGETRVENPDFDLALGDTLTFEVTGTLNERIEASSIVDNDATLSWQTLGDPTQGDQGAERTGTTAASSAFTVDSPTVERRIVESGIESASNARDELVAGERIVHEIVVTLPEGTTRDVVVTDLLDPGLAFDSAEAVSVSPSGAGVTSDVAGGLGSVTPSWDPATGAVRFELGDLVNVESNDGTPETIVIRYTAHAQETVSRGGTLGGRAGLAWDADGDGASGGAGDGDVVTADDTVTIVAPVLSVDNVVSLVPDETGDVIEYTVTIAHTGASDTDAFDVTFSDVVPAGVENLTIASVTGSTALTGADHAGPTAGFALDSAANTVSHAGFDLALGESITLVLTGTAGGSFAPGDSYAAEASIGWTTRDDGDADDGIDAPDTHEATASATGSASFSLSDIAKALVSTGIQDASNDRIDAVVGEYVTYRITVDVPQGTSADAAVVDVLDAGLAFDPIGPISIVPSSGNVTTDAPGGFAAVAPSWDPATRTLDFGLGEIVNTAPAGTVERLVIEYRAFVDASAATGDTLATAVRFERDVDGDGNRGGFQESNVATVEPLTVRAAALELTDTVATPDAIPTGKPDGTADAGDTLLHTLVIAHTGASEVAAFDAAFAHVLPIEHGTPTLVSALDANGDPVSGFSVDPVTNAIVNPDFDLALGDTVTLTVSSIVTVAASAGTTVADAASLDWQGLGEDAHGVQAIETADSVSASASFAVAEPAFVRSIVDTGIDSTANDDLTEVVAGERIVHQLVITVPEGTTPLAAITETLGAGTAFDPDFPVSVVASPGVSFTGDPSAPSAAGTAVGFDLGTVTNTDVDDAAPDTITIRYATHATQAVADGDVLGVDSRFTWDADADGAGGDAPITGTDTVDVIAPVLELANTVVRVPTDTGDTIRYEVVIAHAPGSTADARDLVFADLLPADVENITLVSADIASAGGTAAPVAGFRVDGPTHAIVTDGIDSVDLALGDTITLVIEGTMGADLVEGDTYEANASVTWTTLDAETLDDGATDGLDTAEASASTDASSGFSLAGIVKELVSTGIQDASNDRTDAVVGEYVTYRITVDVPQGTSAAAAVVDVLDAGLAFDPAGPISIVPSSGNVTTDAPGGFAAVAPSWDPNARTLGFELGDIVNTAPAGTVEQLVIEYRAFVDASAATGDTLATAVRFERDVDGDGNRTGSQESTSTTVEPLTVRAAALTLTDTVATPDAVPTGKPDGTADAGDTLLHTLVIAHTGASEVAAFDAAFAHALPVEHGTPTVVSAVDSDGNPLSGFSVQSATDPVTGAITHSVVNPDFDLALGDTVTLTVSSIVTVAASAGTTVADAASLDWQGLGEDAHGVQAIETADSVSASASFAVAEPTFVRSIVDTGIDSTANDDLTEVVAGERIVHQLVVTVPEGTTPLAAITETLGAGTAFDPDFPVSVVASPGVSFTGDPSAPSAAGTAVGFDLGTVTNTDVDDAAPDTITIRYATHATQAVADGDVLGVDSRFTWDADADGAGGDAPIAGTDTVAVIAPVLDIANTVIRVPSDTGDTVRYEIVVSHAGGSTADAYDLAIAGALPAGVENPTFVSAVDAAGSPVTGFRVDAATNAVVHDSVDLGFGDTLTLVIEGTAGPALVEGDTVTAEASVAWGSLDAAADDGAEAAEATLATGASTSFSLGDVVKRIVATGIDDAAADPALLAGIADGAVVVPGEWVEYEITFEVPQGTTDLLEIVDLPGEGVVFDAASGIRVTASSSAVTTSLGDFAEAAVVADGDALRIALGDVTNTAPAGTVETLTLAYRAHVTADTALAAPGDTLAANAVNVRWDIDGDGANDGALDGSTDASAPPLVVAAPELAASNDVTRVPGEHGDRIEYTFVVSHTDASTAGAADVRFSDTLPASVEGLVIESATRADGSPVPGFRLDGGTLVHDDATLPLDDTITVIVSGTVTPDATPGDTVATVAEIAWSSLDEDVPDDGADALDPAFELTGTASDDAGFSVGDVTKTLLGTGIDADADADQDPDPGASGSNGVADVVPGEYVYYEIVVVVPEGGAPVAALVDTLGEGLAFDALLEVRPSSAALSTSLTGGFDAVAAPGPGATGALTFELGDIASTDVAAGTVETLTLTYRAIATDTAAVGAGAALGSDVGFRWDIDGDGDATGPLDGATADAPAPLTVLEPALVIDASIDDVDPHLGQRVTYTLVVDNPETATGTDAHDVRVEQALPPELDLDLASVRVNGLPPGALPGLANTGVAGLFALDVATLGLGDTLVITFEAVVTEDPARADTPLATQATLDWSSLSAADTGDGIDAAERDAETGYTATTPPVAFTPVAPDYALTVTSDATGPLAAGDSLSHTVTVDNVGSHVGGGLVVRVPWPLDALDPPGAMSGGGTYDAATGDVVWRIDTLAPGESASFTVDATVRASTAADIDDDPTTAADAFALAISVTDDGANGTDPDPGNSTVTSVGTLAAAPDYTVTIGNDLERATPTGEVPYAVDVANVGTQAGTNVVVVHRFDPGIVTIVDPAGGVVDAAAGTLTWIVPTLPAGDALRFEFLAEVLPDAFLDTPDQLFAGRVDVTDDAANGADPAPGDNAASHSIMLLGGPGDPAALIGIVGRGDGGVAGGSAFTGAGGTAFGPGRVGDGTGTVVGDPVSDVIVRGTGDATGGPGVANAGGAASTATDAGSRVLGIDDLRAADADTLVLGSAVLRGDPEATLSPDSRVLASLAMRGDSIDAGDHRVRLGEDDLIDGGDLLDVFANDVQTCEVLGIDWSRWEPSLEDLGLEADDAFGPDDGPDRDGGSDDDAVDANATGIGAPGDGTSPDVRDPRAPDLSASLAREYLRLHGPADPALMEAFRDAPAAGRTG